MLNKRSIIKSAGIIGLATLLSRTLGFIRDILIAKFFGTGQAISAFVVAFRIPNTLRDLIGEGASNAAFVPVFSEYVSGDKKDQLWKLVRLLFVILSIGLILITLLGIISSSWIVRFIAPGFSKDPAQLSLTIRLTQIMFPYLLFIGLTAFMIGVLYTFKSFVTPAFGPCILNIVLIGSIFWSLRLFRQPVLGLAISVLIAGLLQLLFQLPALYRAGFSLRGYRLKLSDLGHPDIKRIGKLLGPRTIASAVYQFNIFVDTIFASLFWLVGPGAVSAIFYANRLIQFPLAIFGTSLSNVILPDMSQLAAKNDLDGLRNTLSFSIRMIFLILIPITVGMSILSEPIIRVLFQRGAFDNYSTQLTSSALFFYSLGLLAFGVDRILINGFYSLKDTVTPLKTATLALLLNIILNSILIKPLKIGGLALASSISASLNFIILYLMLNKKIGRLNSAEIFGSFIKISFSSLVMGLIIILAWRNLFLGRPEILRLLASTLIGGLVFVASCAIIKVKELRRLKWILKRD
ncbi:MAG: murein biosynthesis integral membrane protein MurJ [Candidatus Omnitrophota bacterium]